MVDVNVTGGKLSREEVDFYIVKLVKHHILAVKYR